MHICKLEHILTEGQLTVLGEVLAEALETGVETLRLHEQDNPLGEFPNNVEAYVALIEVQKQRMKALQEMFNLVEGG